MGLLVAGLNSVTNLTADRRAVVVMVAETSIERDQPVALALSVLAACPSCQDFKPVAMPAAIGSATAIPTSDEQAGAVAACGWPAFCVVQMVAGRSVPRPLTWRPSSADVPGRVAFQFGKFTNPLRAIRHL